MYTLVIPFEQTEPAVYEKLNNLLRANKKTHWLSHDLTVIPSNKVERALYTLILKRFHATRKLLNINLELSRATMHDIGEGTLDREKADLVIVYNKALEVFNQIAPRYSLNPVVTYSMQKLINFMHEPSPLKPKDPLSEPRPKTLLQTNEFILNTALNTDIPEAYERLKIFQKKGGHVVFFPSINKRNENFFMVGIKKTDQIKTICHMGKVRSSVLAHVMRSIKHKLGCPAGQELVSPPHGMLGGYESANPVNEFHMKEIFEEAFGSERPTRFGYNDPNPNFPEKYWKVDPNCRTIFITFSDTGFEAMHKLAQNNGSLQGCHIVMFPDGDWLSNLKPDPSSILELRALKDPLKDSLKATLKEVCFTNSRTFNNNDAFRNHLKLTLDKHNKMQPGSGYPILHDFFRVYNYRFAFEHFSMFFYPQTG